MTQLRLTFLGSFQAAWGDEPIRGFRSDKARALLAWLAVNKERPHSRASLAALLWGEKPEAAARASLRSTLSNLRQLLARQGQRPSLLITRRAVSLAPGADIWLDTAHFDNLLRRCRAHNHAEMSRCPPCIARLQEMSTLYQGDFLAGLTPEGAPAFAEWQRIQQETRHQQTLTALETLAAHHLQMGEWAAAAQYARRQLALTAWLEPARRQLMQALAGDGRRAEALAQFQTCRRILAEELGAEPEPATIALYRQIKDGRYSPAAPPPLPPHNLPAAVSPFIGREAELAQLRRRLPDDDYRLITITGEGGAGKTRLALAAARQTLTYFPHGVWFAPLEELPAAAAPDSLAAVMAGALHLPGDPPGAARLHLALRGKRLLLLLDNAEHLLTETTAAFLLRLLQQTPGLTLLLTSRALLNVQAEWALRLQGLSFPEKGSAENVERYDSVRLFLERAGRSPNPFRLTAENRPQVAEICRLTAGLPLAIELAAAWVTHYTCAEITAAIRRNLDFLAANRPDLPPRHRSMRAAISHSWELLTPEERAAFARLAVFPGSFSRAAAAEAAGVSLPPLISLVNKSLLRPETEGKERRYNYHPLLAQFARQKLAELEEAAEMEAAHACYYGRLMRGLTADLMGAAPVAALARIRPDLDNFRQAWLWAAAQGNTAVVNQMGDGLTQALDLLGLYEEGRRLAQAAVQVMEPAAEEAGRRAQARIWGMASAFYFRLGQYREAQAAARRALELLAAQPSHIACAHALVYAGCAEFGLGRLAETRRLWQKAADMYAAAGSLWGEIISRNNLAELLLAQGEQAAAAPAARRACELAQQLGNRELLGNSFANLSLLAAQAGQAEEAFRLAEKAVDYHRQTGNPAHLANSLAGLAQATAGLGKLAAARNYLQESVALLRQCGNHLYLINRLLELGKIECRLGNRAAGKAALREALQEAQAAQMEDMEFQAAQALAELFPAAPAFPAPSKSLPPERECP